MWWSLLLACTPSEGPVGLNELAVDGVEDDRAESSPWAEVYNSTGSSVSIEGWMLEHRGTPWELGVVEVPAEGFAVLYFDGEPEQGDAHAPFALTESGGTVFVRDAAGELVQQIEVPTLQADTSYGRRPDGLANWQVIDRPSPGGLNGE